MWNAECGNGRRQRALPDLAAGGDLALQARRRPGLQGLLHDERAGGALALQAWSSLLGGDGFDDLDGLLDLLPCGAGEVKRAFPSAAAADGAHGAHAAAVGVGED